MITYPATDCLTREATRHMVRLLAWTKRAMTPDDLAAVVGVPSAQIERDLPRLLELGMVELSPAGYRVGPRAAVGLAGYVGCVVPTTAWAGP